MPVSNMTTVFLDTRTKGFPGLEKFFDFSKFMPMRPYHDDLYVKKVVSLDSMCLLDLAVDMPVSVGKGENAAIYTHAGPKNFFFPIDSAKSKNDFDIREAAKLSYHIDLYLRDQLGNQGFIDPFLANNYLGYVDPFHKKNFQDKSPDYLKIDKFASEMLMDDFAAVRNLRINHLAIRACRVGESVEFMKILGRLFGAKTVSAPRLRTAAVIGAATGFTDRVIRDDLRGAFYEAAKKLKHGIGGTHMYQYPNRRNPAEPLIVSFQYQKVTAIKFALFNFVASHPEALAEFLRATANFDAAMAQVAGVGVIAFHALQGPNALIFPREPEYVQNLTFVTV